MCVVFRLLLVSLLLTFGVQASATANEVTPRVSVLVYHRFGTVVPGMTTIRPTVFAEQLEWLKTHGIAVLPLHAVVDAITHKSAAISGPAVALTADDGHRSIYSEMYPLIRRYGFHVTLFIYPSAISNAEEALSWEQLDEMVRSGFVDVQSHTYWHPNFQIEKRRLDPMAYEDFANTQLTKSKDRLETRLGVPIDLLAWPFGLEDPDLARRAEQAGYIAAFTIERRPIQSDDDRYALPRFQVTDADRGARFAALITGTASGEEPQ